ncbi:MAG: DCC1-like thiol-disulfide oxidoreductase family protein [Fimbriimonadaceae bacterium]
MSVETWNLYYDGGCNLCHKSQLRAERWAKRAGQPLHAEVLQSEEAVAKGYEPQTMVLEADSKVYTRADAWLRLMAIAPWYIRWLSWFRLSSLTRAIAKVFYEFVARIRFAVWGRRACPIPPRPPSPPKSQPTQAP